MFRIEAAVSFSLPSSGPKCLTSSCVDKTEVWSELWTTETDPAKLPQGVCTRHMAIQPKCCGNHTQITHVLICMFKSRFGWIKLFSLGLTGPTCTAWNLNFLLRIHLRPPEPHEDKEDPTQNKVNSKTFLFPRCKNTCTIRRTGQNFRLKHFWLDWNRPSETVTRHTRQRAIQPQPNCLDHKICHEDSFRNNDE